MYHTMCIQFPNTYNTILLPGTDQFVIVHYADNVSYLCYGFIAKNLDAVNESHIELLMTSSVCHRYFYQVKFL